MLAVWYSFLQIEKKQGKETGNLSEVGADVGAPEQTETSLPDWVKVVMISGSMTVAGFAILGIYFAASTWRDKRRNHA